MIGTLHIVVAMKPLEGNFVQNALRYGVAGLNIDGVRIKGPKGDGVWGTSNKTINRDRKFNASPEMGEYRSEQHSSGRYPSNVILEGCSVKAMDDQSGDTSSTRSSGNMNNPKRGGNSQPAWGMSDGRDTTDYRDKGGASRFFKQVR